MPGPGSYDTNEITESGPQKSILGGKLRTSVLEDTFTPGPGRYFVDDKGFNKRKIKGFKMMKHTSKKRKKHEDIQVSPMTYSPKIPSHTSRGALIGTSNREDGKIDTSHFPGPNAHNVKGSLDTTAAKP